MARLIVNPGSNEAWERELAPGTYTLGRGPENDLAIEHPSVSSTHCRLTITGNGVRLEDLGSVSGTFVDGQLVEATHLRPGDSFSLGEVAMQLQAGSEPVAEKPEVCREHPLAAARHYCPQCRRSYCDLCVTRRAPGGAPATYCRQCGTDCIASDQPQESVSPDFIRSLTAAFGYPLKGNGLILILAGGAFFLLLGWLPFVGFLLTGYLFNYAKSLVATSAQGSDEPPDWPDLGNLQDDILVPYLHWLALLAVTSGPAILLALVVPADQAYRTSLILAGVVTGACVAPMAMLALSILDSLQALNPVTLIVSIARIPLRYFIAAVAFGVVLTLFYFCEELLRRVLPLPIVPGLLAGFLNLYFLAVSMRILGLLYRTRKNQLGWFRK